MAQQIINVGTTPNDGTGEPLREAFTAVNENFTEIYAAGPVGSNVVISGNTITVTGTNNNLVLSSNGIGNVQTNSSLVPGTDSVYNLGSANLQFNTVYGAYFVGNGAGLTGVVANAGSKISNVDSNVSVLPAAVTVGIQTQGNVVVFERYNTSFLGNLLPAANITYNLGSATQAWNDLYLSGNTIYLNNATITSNATALTFTNEQGGQFILDGTGEFSNESIKNGLSAVEIAQANGNISMRVATTPNVAVVSTSGVAVTGQVSATGNIVGSYILGNGALLSGLPQSYSNANVASYLPTYSGILSGGSANIAGSITAFGNVNANNAVIGNTVTANAAIFNRVSINQAIDGDLLVTANVNADNFNGIGKVSAATATVTGNVVSGNLSTTDISLAGNITSNLQVTGNVTTPRLIALDRVSAVGNVYAGQYLFGDGGFLSNVTAAANVSATQLGNGSTILGVAGADGNITGIVSGVGNVIVITPDGIESVASISAVGNISGDYVIGNGRFLTGLSPNSIYNGNSEVNIGIANGNANITIGDTSNVFVATTQGVDIAGNVAVTNQISAAQANVTEVNATDVNANVVTADQLIINAVRSDDSTNVLIEDGLLVEGGIETPQVTASAVSVSQTVSAVGNIIGGNINTNGAISTTGTVTAQTVNALGNVLAQNLNATSVVSAQGNVIGGNINAPTGLISAAGNVIGNNINALQSVTGTIISASANVVGGNVNTGNLSVSGNVLNTLRVTANVEAGNFTTSGQISALANVVTAGYFVGNFAGNITGNLTVPGSNTQVLYNNDGNAGAAAGFTYSTDSNTLTVLGVVSAQGNVIAGNVSTDGVITAAGNVTGANIITVGNVSATGNVSGDYFIGNGRFLSGIDTTLISNGTSNVRTYQDAEVTVSVNGTSNIAVFDGDGATVTGNVETGNVNASELISAVGNVIAGNLVTSGLITATGNITGGNLITAGSGGNITGANVVATATLSATANVISNNVNATNEVTAANVSATANVAGANVVASDGLFGNVFTTLIDSSDSSLITLVPEMLFLSDVRIDNELDVGVSVTAPVVTASVIESNSLITAQDIVVAGSVQGNLDITDSVTAQSLSAGTLSLSGNIVSETNVTGNVTASANISATYFLGNGSQLTGLSQAVSVTKIENDNSEIRIGSPDGNANVTIGGIANVAVFTTDGLEVTGTVSASGNVAVGNLAATGTVDADSINLTQIANIVGNVTGGNFITGGSITATANVVAAGLEISDIDATGNVGVAGNLEVGLDAVITGDLSADTVSANSVSAPVVTTNLIQSDDSTFLTINDGARIDGDLEIAATVSAAGNVTAPYFIGNGSQLTGLTPFKIFNGTSEANIGTPNGNANITINGVSNVVVIHDSGVDITGNVDIIGNVLAANLVVDNIDVNSGNILNVDSIAAVNLSASGNVIGQSIESNGSVTAIGNVTANNINAVNFIDGDILSGNTLDIAGNALIAGDLTVDGNIVFVNVSQLNVEDPIISMGRGPNNDPLTTNDGKDRGEQLWYYGPSELSAFIGLQNSSGNLIAATEVTITDEVVTVSNYGTFELGNLLGATVSASGNITGGNILTTANVDGGNLNIGGVVSATGNVIGGNIETAGDVIGGNITTGGSVTATGNITGGNINTAGLASITGNVIGNIFQSTNLSLQAPGQGNLDGERLRLYDFNDPAKVNYAIGVETSAIWFGVDTNLEGQGFKWYGNNVQVMRLSGVGNLSVVGNVVANANITGANITTAGLVTAVGNITGGNINSVSLSLSGNVISALNASTTIEAAGNITGGNIRSNGTITSTGNVIAPYFIGNVIGNITGNITVSGNNTEVIFNDDGLANASPGFVFDKTSNNVTVIGNISGGNLITAANVDSVNVNASGVVSATGNVIGGNVNAGILSATANVVGGNIVTAGVITSTGNITGGNVLTAGIISSSANVIGGNITTAGLITSTGDITSTSNVAGGNLVTGGSVSAAGEISAVGNVIGGNIVSAGVAEVNSVLASASVSATGNVTGGNIITVGDVSSAGTISATGNVTGGNINTAGAVSAGGNIDGLNVNSSTIISAAGNIVSATTVIAPTIIGNLQGNISLSGNNTEVLFNDNGIVGSDDGFVFDKTTNALSVGGTIATNNGGNLNIAGRISSAGNIIGAANVSGANVLSSGIVSAVGNVTGGNLLTAGRISATGNITGGNVNTTLVAATTLSATGNVIGGNISTAGLITATGNITGGNLITAGSGGNITGANVVEATTLSATANVIGGNIITGGTISATGAISAAGNVTGGNISTAGLITAIGDITSTANVNGGNVVAADALYGNLFTTLIDSDNSTLITLVPEIQMLASLTVDTDIDVGQQLTVPSLLTDLINSTGGSTITVLPNLSLPGNITVSQGIIASTIQANTSINIAGVPVATVDDAVALAIALG